MKTVFVKVAIAAVSLAFVANTASANPEDCAEPGHVELINDNLVCVMPPTELPEPSSPLLFVAAAAIAGAVLKLRKK